MKKTIMAVAAVAILGLASCGNQKKDAETVNVVAAEDSTVQNPDEVVGMEVETPPAGDSNGVIAGAVDSVEVVR